MGYHVDLEEVGQERLLSEVHRRWMLRRKNLCDSVGSTPSCKFTDRHNQPNLHSYDGDSLTELACELVRARAKFPGNRFLLTALMEEVGELAQAMLQKKAEQVKKEALQVACVAIRILEEGDPVYESLTAEEAKP